MERISMALLVSSALIIGCESSLLRNASDHTPSICHEGSRWMDDCNVCTCINGSPSCTQGVCKRPKHKRSIRDAGCLCEPLGSVSPSCDENGNCKCRPNFVGKICDNCVPGFGGYKCEACNCDPNGSISPNCDENSKCDCLPNYTGQRCDRCAIAHGGPLCEACNCNPLGSESRHCREIGQCRCHPNFTGLKCDQCQPNYTGMACDKCAPGFGGPNCRACNCDPLYAMSPLCDNQGQCHCKRQYSGLKCDRCIDGRSGPQCQDRI